MATKLNKPVKRETYSRDHRNRTLIAILEPGDILTFRVKGSRSTYSVTLGQCFNLAQIISSESDYKRKVEIYQLKKKGGAKGLRPPKRPYQPFSKFYFTAIK